MGKKRCVERRDKNGKMIFEGNILLTDEAGWRAKVVFDHGVFILINKGFSLEPNWELCEVIGTVEDNPELLDS